MGTVGFDNPCASGLIATPRPERDRQQNVISLYDEAVCVHEDHHAHKH
jgi:hypothetical protein